MSGTVAPVHSGLTRLGGRRLHLGVCGSVAAYRACDILREWKRLGLHVSVTLTRSACQFVTPLLFEALGALPVYTEMFASGDCLGQDRFAHLEPGQNARAMVIAPVTATTMARLANGLADDMLSAQALAFSGQLVLAPAMNPAMWANPATQANLATLRSRGVVIVGPGSGGTACGDTGQGRLAEVQGIIMAGLKALCEQDMTGLKVMVTLGPTREPWDGVRYWSNPSSGRMGASLAMVAWLRGADVTAICGPGDKLFLPDGIRQVRVRTARQMFDAADSCWPAMDMGMFSAAVADFSPVPPDQWLGRKFAKANAPDGFSVSFRPNQDILFSLAHKRRDGQKLLGFAAETVEKFSDLLPLAHAKLARKDCHLLAANPVNQADCGFGSQTNSLAVVDCSGKEQIWENLSKADLAWDLCTWLLRI